MTLDFEVLETAPSSIAQDAIQPLVDFALSLERRDVPADIWQLGLEQVADTIGTLIAGSTADGSEALISEVASWGGNPESTIALSGFRTTAQNAALVNASMARALDYDDIHTYALGHPSVGVVPVAFAAAELAGGASGEDLVTAVIAGCEVFSRLGMAPTIGSEASGMSHTYQCGIFAGTIAAARLLGLDRDRAVSAMGLAYSMLSGNQQLLVEPVLAIRAQQGFTASSAIVAVRMAARGITGVTQSLEGRYGYFPIYHQNQYDRAELLGGLGEDYSFRKVSRKPYPSCRATHSTIEAARLLRKNLPCEPDDVERVVLTVTPVAHEFCGVPAHEQRWTPSGPRRQFSLPSNFALGFVGGEPCIADYLDEVLPDDGSLRRVAERVEVEVDPALERRSGRRVGPITARLELRDGRSTQVSLEAAEGDPERPLTPDRLRRKFIDCCRHSRRPIEEPEVLYDQLMSLTDLADSTVILNESLR